LKVVFKLPNLMTEGRLRNSQPGGSLAEMQRLCNGHEIPEVSQLHRELEWWLVGYTY
jgi:hypothetical protein